jgi:hypothetical protein
MRDSILQRIFRRVQISRSEGIVLDAILSKANIFGKHARIAHEAIQAITGLARSTVYAAIARLEKIHHLLRIERKVLWYCHNAINVYHVVIPWRADPLYNERQRMGWGKKNNKGPATSDPHIQREEKSLQTPARPCSEKEASKWLTPGTLPWYFAQDLTPPAEKAENGTGNGS